MIQVISTYLSGLDFFTSFLSEYLVNWKMKDGITGSLYNSMSISLHNQIDKLNLVSASNLIKQIR